MQHIDRSRASASVIIPQERPTVRAFSRSELLLTGWAERMKMNASDSIEFAHQRGNLERDLTNKGASILFAEAEAAEAARMEKHGPRPLPRRRRGRGGMIPGR